MTWLLTLLLWATPLPAQEVDTQTVVRGVQERYDSTADFTAAVEQEIVLASAGKTLSAKGKVAFKRPGKMLWTLRGREEQVIVADGSTLWFYEPEEKQVLRAPFQSAFRSTTPISFLTGVGRITENFEPSFQRSEDGRLDLILLPREKNGELGRLRLSVDEKTYDILGAEIVDALGNVTRIRFSDLRRNVGLTDDLFRFEIPVGADVIDAPIGY